MIEKFNAIVVDPDNNTRMRLKHAVNAVYQFDQVFYVGNLRDALEKLKEMESCELFFISQAIDEKSAEEFKKTILEMRVSRDAAWVILASADSQQASKFVSNIVAGVDGILCRPFSADSLLSITEIARKVKEARVNQREAKAFHLLVHEIISQVDQVSLLKKQGYPTRISEKVLQEMCSVLKSLPEESLERYFSAVTEMFEVALVTTVAQNGYNGASERVRKIKADKVLKEVKTMLEVAVG